MNPPAAEHVRPAVFAADGAVRHRVVRVAVVTGATLLAAWLAALALGVLGGFDAPPALPGTHSNGAPAETSARTPPPQHAKVPARPHREAIAEQTAAPSPAPSPAEGGTTGRPQAPAPKPKATAPWATTQPSATGTTTTTATTSNGRGQGLTTTRSSGKPVDSPGNGPGGTGAPGQLR